MGGYGSKERKIGKKVQFFLWIWMILLCVCCKSDISIVILSSVQHNRDNLPIPSNFLVRAWRARLPWEFWLFAFTTFTETRFFHDFYAKKELEGSLFLMPIWPTFFWIKRWIVKICLKYTRYLLFLSGLQRFLWRLWKRKEYNPLLRAREGLENLDVLLSCRKMLISSSVPFQVCSIKLPSSF